MLYIDFVFFSFFRADSAEKRVIWSTIVSITKLG